MREAYAFLLTTYAQLALSPPPTIMNSKMYSGTRPSSNSSTLEPGTLEQVLYQLRIFDWHLDFVSIQINQRKR
ncbi:hypothetical protein ACTXT7_017003 [Hymenolepis weldensis]